MSDVATTKSPTRVSRRKAVLGGVLGNLVEFHDFAIYGLLAGTVSRVFFPEGDPTVALLSTFFVYASSFAVRPLGGLVLGRLGDRLGRLRLLSLTVIGMSLASGAMAILPTYQSIGSAATVLLVLCRLAQGFFAGGEFAGATSFIVEHGSARRRARNAALSPAAAYMGTSFGLLVFTIVSASMPTDAFESWGWRLLFAIAVPLGIVGAYIRYRLEETPEFVTMTKERERTKKKTATVAEVIRTQWRAIGVYIGILMSHTLPNYLAIGFLATYLTTFVGQSQTNASLAVLVSQVTLIFTTLGAGVINDRLGRRHTLVLGCVLLIPLIYGAFAVAELNTLGTSILAGLILVCSYPLISSGMAVGLVEMFPVETRVTAGSIGYNLGTSLFGGTAPMIATFLIQRTGSAYTVATYVAVLAGLTLAIVLFAFNRTMARVAR